MRLSTSLIFTQGYDAIARQQGELFRTQQQVATGKRIVTPADDPVGAARAQAPAEKSSSESGLRVAPHEQPKPQPPPLA